MKAAARSVDDTLHARAVANRWISDNFPEQRKFLSHTAPTALSEGAWSVGLLAWNGKTSVELAQLVVEHDAAALQSGTLEEISAKIDECRKSTATRKPLRKPVVGQYHEFRYGNGLEGAAQLEDASVDLLLTDPPYGISNAYICEKQVPRRLRKDGRDFIMPKGHFGGWDDDFASPSEWTARVLPKVRGWAVIFCAQAQIGDYCSILKAQKFVAVGTAVWHKTNPVPFNHTKKPINAWEAIAIGKRPGTKFNGRVVHNVFQCKSPSPQQRIHPTQKPLELLMEFVKLFSSEQDLVLDPFAGSASTLIAAALLQRRAIGFENDGEIFEKAATRIARTTQPAYG